MRSASWAHALPILIAAYGLSGCSDRSSSPAGPSSLPASPVVSGPQILVGGIPVQGTVNRGTGEPSLFRIEVQAPGGMSTIRQVVLQYSQPGPNHHGGPMMGGFAGTVFCYDDGTHGDDVPGDGIFHFMDPDDRIGCHGTDAPPGMYEYSFWCEDIYGQRSNTATLTIVRQ